ncbi:zinc carboxypeptidase [Pilimelia terevasa]|uniref:Zinc carboxypeptidase n=1 Tax=Pilimelia terevasa TaxID=53372 RepID=A0A8J3BSI4_9ACTN|nr:M14 family metallopeptidase [Pilimelia terevasa]GGK24774.1 zinc carboxypeptidase [Pilimelia terevasa]
MRRKLLPAFAVLGLCLSSAAVPAAAAPRSTPADRFQVYTGTLSPAQLAAVHATGVDREELQAAPQADGRTRVEAILTGPQVDALRRAGVPLSPKQVRGGSAAAAMERQRAAGTRVFRPYSGPGGLREELVTIAARYPGLTSLQTIGHSVNGKPILALRVTKDAGQVAENSRPAVLYAGGQHAREWITPEMNRRLIHHMLTGYGTNDQLTKVIDTTELWFVPVLNPDGYDYTFTEGHRLWRKNLRDTNFDGQITTGDGVDPNRNYQYRWGYDNEGSSPNPNSETYRGAGPNSEPESQALDALARRVDFRFFVNYHSAAELLLYGTGWQVTTPSPDDVIGEALAGDDAFPAVPGYDPDLGAELYTTNGDTDSYMGQKYGVYGFTPEMSTCATVSGWLDDDEWRPEDCPSGFNFPDDERLISMEFRKNVPFALSMALSAKDPADPVSSIGRHTPDLVVDPFPVSYGTSQPVAAVVRRSLRGVKLAYRINGGPTQLTKAAPWTGGERYGHEGTQWFAERRGVVTGARPGDRVQAWFTATKQVGGADRKVTSDRFTYRVHDAVGGDVLVLAAEDVTGEAPRQTGTTAKYAGVHVDALKRAGHRPDVYDFDAQGRRAPHPLGVLSHYRAVVWETGDDEVIRNPGQPAGTAAKAALDTEMAVRDYLNEGGKLILGGQHALRAQGTGTDASYDPGGTADCRTPQAAPCLELSNDFLQYYLGAYQYLDNAGRAPDGAVYPVAGVAGGPFGGLSGGFNGPDSAGNQKHTAGFLQTPSFLPPQRFPQFDAAAGMTWQRPGGGPFTPRDGEYHASVLGAAQAYQRLTRTVDLSQASTGELAFQLSHDTEPRYDYVFVEAHEVGTDNWTTLPERTGRTSTDAGLGCDGNIQRLHPHVLHYLTGCTPKGTTGEWHAVSGGSGGWQPMAFDLSRYAGKRVEVSVTAMTDGGTEGIGVFVDQARVSVGGQVVADTSFEADFGGWATPPAPAGSPKNPATWARTKAMFTESAVVTTPDTVYAGFGLEGLGTKERDTFIGRALTHLKVPARR